MQIAEIDNPSWIESRRRVYSVNGISPTLHGIGCGGNTEPKILENTNCLIQAGNLQGGVYDKIQESCRRVYSTSGIAPTVTTCAGGHREPKIIEDFDNTNNININKE